MKRAAWVGAAILLVATAWHIDADPARLVRGLPWMWDFVRRMVPPDPRVLGAALMGALGTIEIAFLGTVIAAVVAFLYMRVAFRPEMARIEGTHEYFREQLKELGPMSRPQLWALGLFGAATLLAFTRQLGGWNAILRVPAGLIASMARLHQAFARPSGVLSVTWVGSAPRSTAIAWHAFATSVTIALATPVKSETACMNAP